MTSGSERGGARSFTGILGVVKSSGKDLEWSCEVQKIKLFLQGEKNFNGFVRHGGRLVCSHLADYGGRNG